MSIADRIFEDGIMEDENSRNDLNYGDRFYRGDDEEYCYNKTEDKFETINEKNKKMGRMKEEFMQMQEQQQEQLITNKTNLKMKKVEKVEEATMVKETKEETLKRLFLAHGLVKDDVYKDKRGFVIITRTGIDKIVSSMNIQVAYEPVTMTKEWVVLRATASMRTGAGEHDVRNIMTLGEASDDNLVGGGKKFPVAMAEKRGMSRAVLKICGLYAEGIKGEDEMDN